jgi:hypothetical protein
MPINDFQSSIENEFVHINLFRFGFIKVRFQVLTAASMKMTVFWDAAPYRAIGLMMEAVSTSEMSVTFYETTQHNIPEDRTLIALMIEAVNTSETSVNFYKTTRRNIPNESSSWVHLVLQISNLS